MLIFTPTDSEVFGTSFLVVEGFFVNIGCRLFANLSSTPFFGHEDRRESEGHNKNTFEMSESSLLDSASAMTHTVVPKLMSV